MCETERAVTVNLKPGNVSKADTSGANWPLMFEKPIKFFGTWTQHDNVCLIFNVSAQSLTILIQMWLVTVWDFSSCRQPAALWWVFMSIYNKNSMFNWKDRFIQITIKHIFFHLNLVVSVCSFEFIFPGFDIKEVNRFSFVVLTALKQQHVFPERCPGYSRIIHRAWCEQFSLDWW